MFELYILSLNLENGVELAPLPGVLAILPPRRAHRSRAKDVLIAYVSPFGGAYPSSRVLEAMFEEVAKVYYASRGAVTSALRSAAEEFNHLFLRYNAELKGNRKDDQIFGYLNMASLRDQLLYMVHVGPTYSHILRPNNLEVFHADFARGRGLGVSRVPPLSYFQTEVQADDILLWSGNTSPLWSEKTLVGGARLTLNLLRRRLVNMSESRMNLCITQFKAADQTVLHLLKPKTPIRTASPTAPEMVPSIEEELISELTESAGPEKPARQPEEAEKVLPLVEPQEAQSEPTPVPTVPAAPPEELLVRTVPSAEDHTKTPETYPEPALSDKADHAASEIKEAAAPSKKAERVRSRPKARKEPDPAKEALKAARRQASRKKAASMWQTLQSGQRRISSGLSKFFTQLLPGAADDSAQISTGAMFFIALVVPLVVVAVAMTIYMQSGRAQQHQLYLQQAQVYALDAHSAEEPNLQRSNWTQALYWLDEAERYDVSEESQLLRKQSHQALDALDGIERVEFRNLMPFGFSSTVKFTQIAANDTEVYLLDSTQGAVMRMFLTGQGYELDNDFSCGPGASGQRFIGDLVDLIVLPPGSPNNAAVMAVDSNGKLLYCIPGAQAPISGELYTPLEGWGSIQAISYYQGTLYVLDALYSAVYTYRGYNMEFGEEPTLFFDATRDEYIPDLRKMIDIAAYGEDIYLLNENGTIAHCTSGIYEEFQTRCDDPASFGDMRPGMSAETLIFPNAFFAQMQTTQPPDPSLFLLDVNTPAIYRFSLQLNLDKLIQPSLFTDLQMPELPATTFSISPTRVVFLAFNNDVFYVTLP